MANQTIKSLRDFAAHAGGALFRGGRVSDLPPVPYVLRIGTAGHLAIGAEPAIADAVCRVLKALKLFAEAQAEIHRATMLGGIEPVPAELRLISQIAAGFDQLAVESAIASGYRIHAVLPGLRAAFARDVHSYEPATAMVEQPGRFDRLLDAATRVLELDADRADGFSLEDYARAGRVILEHSDILIVGLHAGAEPTPGGTAWLKELAQSRAMPVVHIDVDDPLSSVLLFRRGDEPVQARLFYPETSEVDPGLLVNAFGASPLAQATIPDVPRLGWFERRYLAQLGETFNAELWAARWRVRGDTAATSARAVQADVDADWARPKIWSDNRASAFAELLRGSSIVSAFLTLLAIFGAALGLLYPPLSLVGKSAEVASLAVVIWLALRSRQTRWRPQWLAYRQLERRLDQAAFLALLGRVHGRLGPAPGDDAIALRLQCYYGAVMRAGSFPSARMTTDYLAGVRDLLVNNLINAQIEYFRSESEAQEHAATSLYTAMIVLAAAAITAAVGYIALNITSYVVSMSPSLERLLDNHHIDFLHIAHVFGPIAAWLGILLPAIIAALASIRSFGEYEQLARRFKDIAAALTLLLERAPVKLRTDDLAAFAQEATDLLHEESAGWRAILQYKSLEGV